VYDFEVEKNDVVILGSDGIFDNLFEGQLIAVVNSVQQNGGGPEVRLVDSWGVFLNLPLPKH
jgi:serine/threonine protein phosphatase PrpC